MKKFKSDKVERNGIWTTEFNLRTVNPARQVKLNNLLKLLKDKVVEVAEQ